MRRCLAISTFRCSIPLSRERSCSCVAITSPCCVVIRAFSASGCSLFRSRNIATNMCGVSHKPWRYHLLRRKKSCANASRTSRGWLRVPGMFRLPFNLRQPNTGLALTRCARAILAPGVPSAGVSSTIRRFPFSTISATCFEPSISAPTEHDVWCPNRDVDFLSSTAVQSDTAGRVLNCGCRAVGRCTFMQ